MTRSPDLKRLTAGAAGPAPPAGGGEVEGGEVGEGGRGGAVRALSGEDVAAVQRGGADTDEDLGGCGDGRLRQFAVRQRIRVSSFGNVGGFHAEPPASAWIERCHSRLGARM